MAVPILKERVAATTKEQKRNNKKPSNAFFFFFLFQIRRRPDVPTHSRTPAENDCLPTPTTRTHTHTHYTTVVYFLIHFHGSFYGRIEKEKENLHSQARKVRQGRWRARNDQQSYPSLNFTRIASRLL